MSLHLYGSFNKKSGRRISLVPRSRSRSTRQSIVGLHRQSDYIPFHFADELEDDQITDDDLDDIDHDQITVVLDDHNESDCDSYWDVMFLRQKLSLHPLGRHRRNNTFHCSGDPDDDDHSDSDSGIDADYVREMEEDATCNGSAIPNTYNGGTPIHLHPEYSGNTDTTQIYKGTYGTTSGRTSARTSTKTRNSKMSKYNASSSSSSSSSSCSSSGTTCTPTVLHTEVTVDTMTPDIDTHLHGAYQVVHDMSVPSRSSVTKYNTLNSSMQSVGTVAITKHTITNSEVMELSVDPGPTLNGSQSSFGIHQFHGVHHHHEVSAVSALSSHGVPHGVGRDSMEMVRCTSTDSARSEVTNMTMGSLGALSIKSSFAMKDLDRVAFLKRVMAHSKMAHKHRETERKLQETHGLQNLKVLGDNHIAINIGMAKANSCGDPPIPEGDEHDVDDSGSEPSERSRNGDHCDRSAGGTRRRSPRSPSRSGSNFSQTPSMTATPSSTAPPNGKPQEIKTFKIVKAGIGVYRDAALSKQADVELVVGEIVRGSYDSHSIFVPKLSCFISQTVAIEVGSGDKWKPRSPNKSDQTHSKYGNGRNRSNQCRSRKMDGDSDLIGIGRLDDFAEEEGIAEDEKPKMDGDAHPIALPSHCSGYSNSIRSETAERRHHSYVGGHAALPSNYSRSDIAMPGTQDFAECGDHYEDQQGQGSHCEMTIPLRTDRVSTVSTPEVEPVPQSEPGSADSEPGSESLESGTTETGTATTASQLSGIPTKRSEGIASRMMEIDLAALKPGFVIQRTRSRKNVGDTLLSNSTNSSPELQHTPKFEPVVIQNKRKKRSKKTRDKVVANVVDEHDLDEHVSPQLFIQQEQMQPPRISLTKTSGTSLVSASETSIEQSPSKSLNIEEYKAMILENKEDIMKMIESHTGSIFKVHRSRKASEIRGESDLTLSPKSSPRREHKLQFDGKRDDRKKRKKETRSKSSRSAKSTKSAKSSKSKRKNDGKTAVNQQMSRVRAKSSATVTRRTSPRKTQPVYFNKTRQDLLMQREREQKSRISRSASPRNPSGTHRTMKTVRARGVSAANAVRAVRSKTPRPPKRRKKIKKETKSPALHESRSSHSKSQTACPATPTSTENYDGDITVIPFTPRTARLESPVHDTPDPEPTTFHIRDESRGSASMSVATPTPNREANGGIDARLSFKDRLAMYQSVSAGIGQTAADRVQEIKRQRQRADTNSSISSEQRAKATALLQHYAAQKVQNVADVTMMANTLKDVTKENCIGHLERLEIVSWITVPINEFDRWNQRNAISNAIAAGECHLNEKHYRKNPSKFVRMAVISLLNSKILIKLHDEQKEQFKRLILLGLESCRLIYKINFNTANITNKFLDDILQVLGRRYKNERISSSSSPSKRVGSTSKAAGLRVDVRENGSAFGPELLFLENNPISDRGIEMVCRYVARNVADLKCLKVGHCFGTISSNCCGAFCDNLERNEYILKVTFDMRWPQHRSSVDKSLKRNYSQYRSRQKSYKKLPAM